MTNKFKSIAAYEDFLFSLKKAIDNYEKRGMSVTDDPDKADADDGTGDADEWLQQKEQEKPTSAESTKPSATSHSKDWQPRSDYSADELSSIKNLIDTGYSHREAERLSGAHRGPKDYRSALRSGVNPSMPSDKMMGHLKDLAKEWLENARSHDLANADEMKNPMKHASGQMEQAHKGHTGDYHQAYSDFLSSDAIKNLSPRERHGAVQEWKSKWKQDNPDYEEGLSGVSQVQTKFADAAKNIEQKNKETEEHIARGGVGGTPQMSDQEAMQHLGGGKSDEGYTGGSFVKDPAAVFAAKNPKYVKLLNKDQMDRVKRVDSAAATQGKVRVRKAADTASIKPDGQKE